MNVGNYCNRNVIITYPEESIQKAAKLMRQHHVGCLVIVKKVAEDAAGAYGSEDSWRTPVGILTDRDIVVELIAEELDLNTVTVGDVINQKLLMVNEEAPLSEVLDKMKKKGVRRVPVTNKTGGLVGILALDDLIEFYAEQLSLIVGVIEKERIYEQQIRS